MKLIFFLPTLKIIFLIKSNLYLLRDGVSFYDKLIKKTYLKFWDDTFTLFHNANGAIYTRAEVYSKPKNTPSS